MVLARSKDGRPAGPGPTTPGDDPTGAGRRKSAQFFASRSVWQDVSFAVDNYLRFCQTRAVRLHGFYSRERFLKTIPSKEFVALTGAPPAGELVCLADNCARDAHATCLSARNLLPGGGAFSMKQRHREHPNRRLGYGGQQERVRHVAARREVI